MATKEWTIVQFEDTGTFEAVPSTWIQGNVCYFPITSTEKSLSYIKSCEPVDSTWSSYPVKVMRNSTCDDYEQAISRAQCSTESNSDFGTKKKTSQDVPSSKIGKFMEQEKIAPVPVASSISNEPGPSTRKSPSEIPIQDTEDIKMMGSLLREILSHTTLLPAMNSSIQELKEEIFKSKENKNGNNNNDFWKVHNCPIDTDESFSAFEAFLTTTKHMKSAIEELYKLGGNNVNDFVKAALNRILADSIAKTYNWTGRNGKKALSKTKVAEILMKTGEKHGFKNRKEIEEAIGKWFKRVSNRCKKEHKTVLPIHQDPSL